MFTMGENEDDCCAGRCIVKRAQGNDIITFGHFAAHVVGGG